ncbi:MAG: HTH-type transcriptional regulator TtgR [Syntrophus sp. PtaU1.Bin208]|nr:MAG: HTH-type transcriptional regulator TtgR [Syntrophus sp. PtaU1.Bin208]
MKIPREGTVRTRQNLLIAAGEIFGEKGYRETTIAEICERAGTNIAAVNYHFGKKETLYRESWLNAFRESNEKFPIDGEAEKNTGPEERLRGYIRSLIHRIVADSSDLSILHMEMSNPTGLLTGIMKKKIGSLFEVGKGIVNTLLGEDASEKKILFVHTCILGQCFHLGASRHDNPANVMAIDIIRDIEEYCEHVTTFSLAGITAIKKSEKWEK